MAGPNFGAGGYFLSRPVIRDDDYMSTELLPPSFLSLSDCLTDSAFEYWWNEENAAEAAAEFGVGKRRLPDLIDWYRSRLGPELGAPNVAFSTSVIYEFLREFVDDPSGFVILGCGLSEGHRIQLLENHEAPPDMGEYGVFEMLKDASVLEPGGQAMGFEILSYQYGLEHSWLYNSLERVVESQFGFRPNPTTGLLDSYDEAVEIAQFMNLGEIGAEPGTWFPWLVVQYQI